MQITSRDCEILMIVLLTTPLSKTPLLLRHSIIKPTKNYKGI